MENKQEMMSLFDYLGRAAGTDLGKRVHDTATKLGEPITTRQVNNVRYKGAVCMYRKQFLQEYFSTVQTKEVQPTLGDQQNYTM